MELSFPSLPKAINTSLNVNLIKSVSDNKGNLSSNKNFTKESNFDIKNKAYFTNISSFSKISPFKADQCIKPYFYVKSEGNANQYNSVGNPKINDSNEVSIYDIMNQKEVNIKNRNDNGFSKRKDSDRNMNSSTNDRMGFTRKVVGSNDINQYEDCYLNKHTNRPNYLNLFLNYYENLSNLHVLLKSITPFIDMKSEYLVSD